MVPFASGETLSEPDLHSQVLVVGSTGSGKTNLLICLVVALCLLGRRVIFCTSKHDPAVFALVERFGGQRITSQPGKATSWVDPLAVLAGIEDPYLKADRWVETLGSSPSSVGYGEGFFKSLDNEVIYQAFLWASQNGRVVATVSDLDQAVRLSQEGRKQRREETSAELFVRLMAHVPVLHPQTVASKWDVSFRGLTYLDTSWASIMIQGALTRLVAKIAFDHAKTMASRGTPDPTYLIIDEAGQSIFSDTLMTTLAKEGRSLSFGMVVSVQDLELLRPRKGANPGTFLWNNSGIRCVFGIEDAQQLKNLLALCGEKTVYDRTFSTTFGQMKTFTQGHGPRLTTGLEANEVLEHLRRPNGFLLLRRGREPKLATSLWAYRLEDYQRLQGAVWPEGPVLTLPTPAPPPAPPPATGKKPPLTPEQRKENARRRFEKNNKRKNP